MATRRPTVPRAGFAGGQDGLRPDPELPGRGIRGDDGGAADVAAVSSAAGAAASRADAAGSDAPLAPVRKLADGVRKAGRGLPVRIRGTGRGGPDPGAGGNAGAQRPGAPTAAGSVKPAPRGQVKPAPPGPAKPAAAGPVKQAPGGPEPRPVPAKAFSGRLLALAVVLLTITLLLAPSVRTFLQQRSEITALQQDIEAKKQQESALKTEISRWSDPAYVKQQARDRVNMMMPGETGYWVYGGGGIPATPQDSGGTGSSSQPGSLPWVDGLWQSIQRSATE